MARAMVGVVAARGPVIAIAVVFRGRWTRRRRGVIMLLLAMMVRLLLGLIVAVDVTVAVNDGQSALDLFVFGERVQRRDAAIPEGDCCCCQRAVARAVMRSVVRAVVRSVVRSVVRAVFVVVVVVVVVVLASFWVLLLLLLLRLSSFQCGAPVRSMRAYHSCRECLHVIHVDAPYASLLPGMCIRLAWDRTKTQVFRQTGIA